MTDDKLKRYFDALWEEYGQVAQLNAKHGGDLSRSIFYIGYRAGLDYAIETLKTVFEIAEKALPKDNINDNLQK